MSCKGLFDDGKVHRLQNTNKDTTNLDSAIGTNLKVISGNADDEFGTVKYNGVVWNVKTEDGAKIKAGDNVEVLRVEGTKFIVKKAKKEHKGEQK